MFEVVTLAMSVMITDPMEYSWKLFFKAEKLPQLHFLLEKVSFHKQDY